MFKAILPTLYHRTTLYIRIHHEIMRFLFLITSEPLHGNFNHPYQRRQNKIPDTQDSISYALYTIKTSAALVLLMCLFSSPYLGLLETIFNVIIKLINLFINLNPN